MPAKSQRDGKRQAYGMLCLPPEPPAPEPPRGVSIAEATDAYLAKCQNRGIQPATLNKYRTFVKQLRAYGEARG